MAPRPFLLLPLLAGILPLACGAKVESASTGAASSGAASASTSSSAGSGGAGGAGTGGAAGTGGGPVDCKGMPLGEMQAFYEIGACMSATDWQADGLTQLASTMVPGLGSCTGCHNTGIGGVYLNAADPSTTFDKNRVLPQLKEWFAASKDGNGKFLDLVPSHGWVNAGPSHPAYMLPPALVAGIDMFVNTTLDRWHKCACPAP